MSHKQYLYIDPFTDFGFKAIFMNPKNKAVLLQFINAVMERVGEREIIDLQYLPTEHIGLDEEHKKVVQDLECVCMDGRHFIVEMQRAVESDFRDRMAFYAFRASIENVYSGDRYRLKPVYCLVLMEESLRKDDSDFVQIATLRYENSSERFLHHPIFIMLETEKVPEHAPQERTLLEHLCYCLRNMGEWSQPPSKVDVPESLKGLLYAAKIANLSVEEQKEYLLSIDGKRNMKFALEHKWETGLAEGLARGLAEGISQGITQGIAQGISEGEHAKAMETVRRMLDKGYSWTEITDLTGVTQEEYTPPV